ncbi:unnamed protein product [Mucor hiemalis]
MAEETEHHKVDEVTPLLTRQRQGSWENDAKRPAKKPSAWYIIIPLFVLTFGFGALFAPMIQFYTVVFCYRYYQSQTGDSTDIPLENCAIPEVQAIVSEAQAVIMFLTYGSTLLLAGYYGALSDRKGRRLVLNISCLGNILLILSYILTIKFPGIFGISLLFIVPVIRGLMAGDNVLIATAQAYISDCTTASGRTIAFGHMMASIFMGATLGPFAASILMKQTGSILSIFYMVLFNSILFELYVFLILPESNDFRQFKPAEHQTKELNFLQRINVFSALKVLFRSSTKHANRYALPLIAGTQFCLNFVMLPPILLYAMLKFHWSAYEGGLFVSLASFTKLLVLVGLLPLLSRLFHKNKARSSSNEEDDVLAKKKLLLEETEPASPSSSSSSDQPVIEIVEEKLSEADIRHAVVFDSWMIRVGTTVEIIGFVGFGLATTSASFSLTLALQSFSALAGPSIRSLATTLVKPSEIGEVLGAMAVIESCASKYILIPYATIKHYSLKISFFINSDCISINP